MGRKEKRNKIIWERKKKNHSKNETDRKWEGKKQGKNMKQRESKKEKKSNSKMKKWKRWKKNNQMEERMKRMINATQWITYVTEREIQRVKNELHKK